MMMKRVWRVGLIASLVVAGCSEDGGGNSGGSRDGGVDPEDVGVDGSLRGVDPKLDSDGDGKPDVEEGTADADGDGIPAHLDPDEEGTAPEADAGGNGGGSGGGDGAANGGGTAGDGGGAAGACVVADCDAMAQAAGMAMGMMLPTCCTAADECGVDLNGQCSAVDDLLMTCDDGNPCVALGGGTACCRNNGTCGVDNGSGCESNAVDCGSTSCEGLGACCADASAGTCGQGIPGGDCMPDTACGSATCAGGLGCCLDAGGSTCGVMNPLDMNAACMEEAATDSSCPAGMFGAGCCSGGTCGSLAGGFCIPAQQGGQSCTP